MEKVLFVASVAVHITSFHIPYLKMLKEAGYEVHVACNGEIKNEYIDKHYNLPFERSPLKKANIEAYKELKKIIDKEKYSIIECNTPVASVITRLAAKKSRKNGTRVIYIAHGFHFYKGAPIKNWLLFYPIEKICSNFTDDLVTINEEDYQFAKKKMKAKNIHYIHGIGVDETKFNKEITASERNEIRKKLNLKENDFAMFFVGELNNNKNQIMLIEAMKDLIIEYPNFKLLLAGNGPLKEFFETKIKEYKLENNVFLLGYRNDIPNILKAIEVYVSTSKREGLPINIVEAKMSGLPIIVTNIRGHRELVKNNETGYIVEIGDVENLKEKIKLLYSDESLKNKFISNSKNGLELYSMTNVFKELRKIL